MERSDQRPAAPGFRPPAFGSMFSRPAATLDSLREQPRWFYPLLVAAVYSAAVNFYVIWRIGLQRLMNASLQANVSVDPQAVLESALAHKTMILFSQGLASFAGTFVTAFVVAKVLWLILTVIGQDLYFRKVLAVVAHVTMLTVVIRQSMLAVTATVIPSLDNLDIRNPLATNLAFFLHPKSPLLFRLLSSFDLITFTNILLLGLGLNRVSNRLSFRTACILVLVPWGVYTGASLLMPAGF
jgi:hypothetical protein